MEKEFKITCSFLLIMIVILFGILFMYFDRKYEVIFDTDGGSVINSYVVSPGQTITSIPTPLKEGYVFLGWYMDGEDQTYDFSMPINKTITLKAKWQSII